jgi:hypothetical protein
MDDIVRQALLKWPHVPHCYGWLGLDSRGNWTMRDDRAQALGGFASGVPGAKGALLQHRGLIDFIGRNYDHDADGQWFFQNGPQRVYVELEAAPWVWRLAPDGAVSSHTGLPATVQQVLTDEAGHVFLVTELGLGLVHTLDVGAVADAVEQGRWQPLPVRASELPMRFGYVRSPQARTQGDEKPTS